MAHYIRFDTYLPTRFKDSTGVEKSVSDEEIEGFCLDIRNRFGGYTESNPAAAPPFKGWWISKDITYTDYPILIFTLVRLEKENEAKKFFDEWKTKLEKKLNQEFILICFFPIQILGEL